MKKRKLRLLALVLAAAMLLCGCELDFTGYLKNLAAVAGYRGETGYAQMAYTRPDMDACDQALRESCSVFKNAGNLDSVLNAIYAYYDVYDSFYTNYNLAYIHYCADVADSYWQEEYAFCAENSAVMDAGLEELYYALAESTWRSRLETDEYFGEGYFDAYEEESVWDETFLRLMEEEAAIKTDYYEIYQQSLDAEYYSEEYFSVYGTRMAEIFVQLIAKRQEIAAYVGYDSYPRFAYDFYFYRDYSPEDAQSYLRAVGEEMEDLYRRVNQSDVWDVRNTYCSEDETFAYVRSCAEAMGGNVLKAFEMMEENGLYDIAYGARKLDGSFEVYLASYYSPFVFVSPYLDPYDKLTFAHEFGHFANDYLCGGSYVGTDIAEVHSQGMEYLSLFYGENTAELERLKMADCLSVYVEQAAYALFEHQVYSLTGEDLTTENVQALYAQICTEFGFDSWAWDSRDYVMVEHFFSSPMYVVSYVVSNDVAFQLYRLERQEKGAGLAVYAQCLYSEDSYIVTFAEQYGLENPFRAGRIEQVRQTLEEILG